MLELLCSVLFVGAATPQAPAPSQSPVVSPTSVAPQVASTADGTRILGPVDGEPQTVRLVDSSEPAAETLATIELPAPVAGVAVAADGDVGVVVAPGGDGGVVCVQLEDGTTLASFPSASELVCRRCVAVARDGGRTVVAGATSRPDAVTVLALGAAPFVVAEVPLAAAPEVVEISPDQRFAVVHTADGMVTVLRLHDGGVVGSYRREPDE